MGATASVQVPSEAYKRYRDIIQQTIVPPNLVSKGDTSFRSLDIYRYVNDADKKAGLLRPVRKSSQAYYATRPTFLGRSGPTHLIGTIAERSLARIPTKFTDEESMKVNIAYKLLLHTLNICAIILGSETPDAEESGKDRMLLQTLRTLYKQGPSASPDKVQSTGMPSLQRSVADIIANATATIANIEDKAQQMRKENTFLTFDNNLKVIQDIARYITPRKESPSSSMGPIKQTKQLSIFREVLNHVNTLTVCGVRPNTLLGRLSKAGEYPDILTVVASDMAAVLEKLLPEKSSTIRTMVRWATQRLRGVAAYGSGPDDIVEGAVMKRLFMKQGAALHKATEDACSSLTKQFGDVALPAHPDGVVVHTADKADVAKQGEPVKQTPRPNKAATQLYTMIQRENRAMGNAAIKAFEALFTITPEPVPGSISLPITLNAPEVKQVYATIRQNVIQSADPLATLTDAAAVLVYTIAVAYDNLWMILSKENMKKVYGFSD